MEVLVEKPSFDRVYDKEGLGYITTDTLRGLISELLAPLTDEELEGILEVTMSYTCTLFSPFCNYHRFLLRIDCAKSWSKNLGGE